MRPSLLVTFVLFSILISHVQGIRLNKGFLEDNKTQKGIVTRTRESGADVEAVSLKDKHNSGDARKLVAKATPNPSITTSKNDGNKSNASPKRVGSGGKDESLSVSSTLASERRGSAAELYPDIIDLAGMDYTPAKRKPPIHN